MLVKTENSGFRMDATAQQLKYYLTLTTIFHFHRAYFAKRLSFAHFSAGSLVVYPMNENALLLCTSVHINAIKYVYDRFQEPCISIYTNLIIIQWSSSDYQTILLLGIHFLFSHCVTESSFSVRCSFLSLSLIFMCIANGREKKLVFVCVSEFVLSTVAVF